MYIFTVLILYALKPMISVYNVIVFISHSLWFVKSILRGDYQNDRYLVPKWPLFFTKMTVVWPKWPLFLRPKWPLVHHQNDRCVTKMTVIFDQNDRYQNDRYWLKWPLFKMTVIPKMHLRKYGFLTRRISHFHVQTTVVLELTLHHAFVKSLKSVPSLVLFSWLNITLPR